MLRKILRMDIFCGIQYNSRLANDHKNLILLPKIKVFILLLLLIFFTGRMEMFIAVINSYVHIIMYAYYFFSSYKRFFTVTNKIKPFITVIQIVQLFLILVQCIAITLCEKSSLNYAIVINFILNIILFSHFFMKAYLWKPKRRVENNNNNNNNNNPDAGKNRQIVSA